jgi:hypothetical protein
MGAVPFKRANPRSMNRRTSPVSTRISAGPERLPGIVGSCEPVRATSLARVQPRLSCFERGRRGASESCARVCRLAAVARGRSSRWWSSLAMTLILARTGARAGSWSGSSSGSIRTRASSSPMSRTLILRSGPRVPRRRRHGKLRAARTRQTKTSPTVGFRFDRAWPYTPKIPPMAPTTGTPTTVADDVTDCNDAITVCVPSQQCAIFAIW